MTATGYQADQIVVSDQSGGFITLWVDQRNGQNDMYAQLTNDNITVTNPLTGEIWNGTIDQTITWSLNTETVVFDHLSLKASAGGVDYPITDNISPSLLSHTWTSPGINSTDVTLYIQARNKNNDIICSYQSQTFTLDSEPPLAFSLLSPADNETVEKIITFEWEATSDNLTGLSHYDLWIDGSLFQDNIQETTYTLTPAQALSTGPHTWTVRAVDNAGVSQEPAENSMEVVYDNTPPLAFHLLSPENNTYTSSTSPLFSWENTTDPGGLLDSYKFYLDGSLIADIPPDQTSFSDPVLTTTGTHNWYITAVDTANNITPSSETWTVLLDNAPPDNFSLLTPASNTWINDTTPLFTWEETTDSSGGIGLAEYELWIDDNLIIDNISADNQEVQLPTSQSLSEGVYTWYIEAKDSLENSRNSQADFTLKIDVTQPSSFDLVTPEDNAFINILNPDFSWTSSEDILSGLEKYQLYINGSLNKDNISALQTKPVTPLTEGSYSWSVTARDSAGNIRNINTFEFTADTTSPEPFQLITPENNTTIYMDKPQFSWQPAVDNLAGIKNYSLLIDGSITADNLYPDQTVFTISQSLDNSTHTWQIIAYDSAGNFRSTAIFQFQVLSNPPVITSASQVQATEDILFSYTAQAEDPDLQEVEITFSQYPSWLSPSQNEISGTPVEDTQDTSFLVIATDGYYYDSLLVEVTVIPVNDPPEITSPENASATEDEMFTYIATAQDPDNEVLEYIFEEYPSWLIPQENYITGTPTEGKSDSAFTVIVTDGELTDTLKVPLTITAVNDPPQITSTPSISVLEDELLSYTVTAHDPDNEILIFSYIEKPFWLAVSDQTIEGYARQNYTDTCFTVTVTDGTLSDTLEVSVDIVYVNDSPVILSSNKVTAIEDSLFTYIPQAGDPDNETIIFSFTDYPTWLLPGENKISGTPTEGKQDTCFTVIASDGQLSDTMKVALTVIPVNDPPVITSSDTVSAIENKSFSYQATAKDVDSENISITFAEYPAWLSVTGSKIKGTPGDNCQDTTFTVIASDTKLSDTLKVTLKIIRINDPPIFITSLPRDITITNRDTFTCELKNFITDPDNSLDDLTWTHTVLDTNTLTITINQKSQLAKICGEKTHGSINIIFKVSDPQGASAQDTLQFYINKTTSINDYTLEQIPERFILQDNYPNPFNNSTTLKYG
ncbi:MAG: Ig-like domain-containing protein, partial [bacterium]